jgi:hypothetical protein
MSKYYKIHLSITELVALEAILKAADSWVLKDLTDEVIALIEEQDLSFPLGKRSRFIMEYECPCGEVWFMQHDCACNDRCPSCNKENEPVSVEDV